MYQEESTPLVSERRGFFHPTRSAFRWVVLFFVALICFGSYFAYDSIQPFADQLNKTMGISPSEFQNLYAIYSFPNIILVFFGGLLGDKIGLRLSGLIFVLLVFIGAIIVPLATTLSMHVISHTQGYWMMMAGRFIFGLGGESLNVIQTSMTALWFKGTSSTAFAMGLTLSSSRLGDFLALSISPYIAEGFGDYRYAIWVGAILSGVSLIAVLIYSVLDKASERHFPGRKVDPAENELNFRAILNFDPRFWIVSFLCMTYYSGVLPFVAIASEYFENVYHFSPTKAGWYSSIVILASMILSPFLGKFLDLVGRRPFFVVLGSCVILPAHLMLAFLHETIPPIIPVTMIGLSFSLVPSGLWPAIPLITKDSETATAFGLMASIQNLGLTITNFGAGRIAKINYQYAMLFFAAMDILGLVLGLLLIVVDKARGGALSKVTGQKTDYEPINTTD